MLRSVVRHIYIAYEPFFILLTFETAFDLASLFNLPSAFDTTDNIRHAIFYFLPELQLANQPFTHTHSVSKISGSGPRPPARPLDFVIGDILANLQDPKGRNRQFVRHGFDLTP
jgi:hypothetical protein